MPNFFVSNLFSLSWGHLDLGWGPKQQYFDQMRIAFPFIYSSIVECAIVHINLKIHTALNVVCTCTSAWKTGTYRTEVRRDYRSWLAVIVIVINIWWLLKSSTLRIESRALLEVVMKISATRENCDSRGWWYFTLDINSR